MIHVKDGAFKERHVCPMSVSFHVVPLSGDQVSQAFPLIQVTSPGADLGSWLSFVEFFSGQPAAQGTGVLALHDPKRYICGILAYRLDRDLRAGSLLTVQLFTAVDLINSLRPVRALLDAAEARACELGCTGIQIRVSGEQTGLASRLRALGLSSEGELFCKKINPARPAN